MPFVGGTSLEASGRGETGGGLKVMIVGPGGTGSEGRSVEPGNSGGRETNASGYRMSTLTSWIYW